MLFLSSRNPSDRQKRQDTLLDIAYFAVLSLLCLVGIWFLARYLLPFVLAFLTAMLLQRPLRFLVKCVGGRQRYFSVVLVILLVGALTAVAVLLGMWLLQLCLRFFGDAQNLEIIRRFLTQTVGSLSEGLNRWTARLSEDSRLFFSSMLEQASTRLYDMAGQLFANAAQFLLSFFTAWLPSFLLAFLTWIVATVFFTAEYEQIKQFLFGRLPCRFQSLLSRTGQLCGYSIAQLCRAYLLLMLLTFSMLALGLWLLRIPNAVWLAALIALVDLLPILGVGTVLIPWAILAFTLGSPVLGGGLLALFGIVLVVRNIIEPRLIGRRIGLHPLATLAAMYVGLRVAGLCGLLLFPLALTVLWCLRSDPCMKQNNS